MTESAVCPVPHERAHPLRPPVGWTELTSNGPVKLRWPNGIEGWVISTYAGVRQVLSDPRFTSVGKPAGPAMRTEGESVLSVDQPGNINGMDGDAHMRLRRPLSRGFMVKRMNELRPRIQQIVDEHLDDMEAKGAPADLVSSLCLPVPSLVIAELLGVSPEHQELFQAASRDLLGKNGSKENFEKTARKLAEVLSVVVQERKAAGTTDDMVGLMVNETDFEMEELLFLCITLLVAGHETTTNFMGLFTLNLFERPDQLEILKRDPDRADVIVEELMRFSIGQISGGGLIRRATADIEVEGVIIREGEWVSASLSSNLDEALCERAGELDLDRQAVSHLGFGFGPHQCLGANLARAELQIMLRTLFTRFPGLRPAVPVTEMTFRTEMTTYGPAEIPVVW